MSQPQELLRRVITALEAARVDYMLTGSIVSSFHGEPRSTHDIDIVVVMRHDQIDSFSRSFPKSEYAFDEIAASEAIRRADMFQLMEFDSGDKIDFWILQDHPFDRESFSRRYRDIIVGIEASLPRPEDTILQKLRWAHEYESEKQFNDALGVFELQAGKLDPKYMERWVTALGLQQIWTRLQNEAKPMSD